MIGGLKSRGELQSRHTGNLAGTMPGIAALGQDSPFARVETVKTGLI